MHFDYTTLGHVTIDVLADGSRQPGGSAFYSALQAARLGLRARIVTRGRPAEVQELLEPYRTELELTVLPSPRTTTLQTSGAGAERQQRVLAWAGPLPQDTAVDSAILHLAPVARETPTRWRGRPSFVGLTPQGLAREWCRNDGVMTLSASDGEGPGHGGTGPAGRQAPPGRGLDDALGLAERCDAIVASEEERASCSALIAAAVRAGAVVAITNGPRPATILRPDGRTVRLPVTAVDSPREDLGAGDVFAAAFFVALADGRPAERAAAFGSAAAAVRMQGAGAGSVGRLETIEARVSSAAVGLD